MNRYICFLLLSLSLGLIGCLKSFEPEESYCDTHKCLPSTEIRHRPTSFAVELHADDSLRVAWLYTVDCAYLPDEDVSEQSTFCVDSIKYGDDETLHHLPQKSKYEEPSNLEVFVNGRVLGYHAEIPLGEDDHLRFTLVDREYKEKSFDIDLSAYVNIYELYGDSFTFNLPPKTDLTAYSNDTTFDVSRLPKSARVTEDESCFFYSFTRTDSTFYCFDTLGYFHPMADSSLCPTHRVERGIISTPNAYVIQGPCYKIEYEHAKGRLTLSNLYSLSQWKESVKDSVPPEDKDLSYVREIRHPWHTVNYLNKQGPDGEDDFTIYVVYRGYEKF
ncbi:hypothetical protein [uncultured Fibrobacter sp.]|uniref:hypothetical protein n=1 Tax=uncultured Fibrobacter sp. TaxID=261512 RepID=UPI0026146E3B|nr:hypothetical protein [uncultured Fibrobacter sp.]